ncbi:MAG: ABC transporter substrate-binding protein [Dehalococcoidia bacterium]|nr:ABC transporter substrate-binding protein [Dehalococcoidia bacterium]
MLRGIMSAALIAALTALVLACSEDADEPEEESETGSVRIGALLPLTGSLSSYGETSKAALDEAVTAINTPGWKPVGWRPVELIVEDTKTEPAVALEKLRALQSRGVKLVIGPYASSEVREVKAFADSNGIVLISPLSTSRALAIAGDNIFRFTPDDEAEGKAIAALAWADGIRVIVPVTRDDEGNKGLQAAMKVTFEGLGGRFLPGVTYATNETDFRDEMITVAAAVNAERLAGHQVGVYLTAFNEVTGLFGAAAIGDPVLATVMWYGSDSVALSKDLVEDRTAAAFAVVANYPNPILGLNDSDRARWGPISDKVSAKLGRVPDAFALAAYDGLMVGYNARVAAGTNTDALKRELVSGAASYSG